MTKSAPRFWLVVGLTTIAWIGAFVPGALAATAMGLDEARHLLHRTGFAAGSKDVGGIAELSRTQAIERLLAATFAGASSTPPAWIDEPIITAVKLRQMTEEDRRAHLAEQRRRAVELRGWWIGEMLATQSPLTERMTLFWHNHFVSSQAKVRVNQLMYRQNVLLRRHALGSFAELLHAIAKDAAMVIYLDSATNRKARPNENFARELLELFTLGEGFYTEQDIREVARTFTGWSIDPESGEFLFRRAVHDDGVKTVLGQTGAWDGDQVLDLILAQPRTGEWIVTKLWREFVSPQPNVGEVGRIAGQFRASGYQIKVALRALLSTDAFWAAENRATLVKSPVELVVGSVKQLAVEVPDPLALAVVTALLGQNLFAPPNVKGWPGGETWINSASLLARKQFMERLIRADTARELPITMEGAGKQSTEADAPPTRRREARGAPLSLQGVPPAIRGPIVASMQSMQFDSRRWQVELERVPGLTAERLLLAAAPAQPVPVGGMAPRDVLNGLLFDPMFQLK